MSQEVVRQITDEQILDWLKDMDRIVEFFESRDTMNAAVHVGDVRYSPITELARQCRMTIATLRELQ